MLRMQLHEGLLGTVLLLGQGLVLVLEQPRQKNLLEQAELLGVMVGRRRGLGVVVGVVVVHPLTLPADDCWERDSVFVHWTSAVNALSTAPAS